MRASSVPTPSSSAARTAAGALEVRDAIRDAHDEDRGRGLVMALVQVIDCTWPRVLGRLDVQQTFALTPIAGREQLDDRTR